MNPMPSLSLFFLCHLTLFSHQVITPPQSNPFTSIPRSLHIYIRQNILRLITSCVVWSVTLSYQLSHLHTIMADTFRPRFGRLGSIVRMEQPPPPAPDAAATTAPPPTSTARPATRPQLQPQPTGLFRGTASVPSSPILPTRSPPSGVASVPTSPIPMATSTGTSSLPQSPVKPSAAPTTGTSSLPQFPVKQLNGPTAGTSSLPQSPAKFPPPPAPLAQPTLLQSPPTTKEPSPVKYSPKSVTRGPSFSPPRSSPKKLVSSPKTIKPTSPPPSPLRLPPSQITADPEPEPAKRQLVSTPAPPPSPQHKAKVLHEHDKIMDSTKVVHNKAQELPLDHSTVKPHSKSWASSDEESGLRMITIAGENRGAVMELLPSSSSTAGSPMKSKALHGEEAAKAKKDGKGVAGKLSPLSAFVNSNVQGVNNSILLNASSAHNSPGVHLAVTHRPSGRPKELPGGEAHLAASHHA